MKSEYHKIQPYVTKDGSIIRELWHPKSHGDARLSVAEAIIPRGVATLPHRHVQSEEVYHILAGSGMMSLGNEQFSVTAGDTIGILPGTPHSIRNAGSTPLKLLCCCSPPYAHDDTELLPEDSRKTM